jgi:hypothetical protein
MKKYLILLLFVLPSLTQGQSLKAYKSIFNGPLKNWTQTFTGFNLADFKPVDAPNQFLNTDRIEAKNKTTFYPIYKTALTTSPNGQYVIDSYAYLFLEKKQGRFTTTGSDVEQSIRLGDVRQNKWRQIAYYGYGQRVEEVTWVNDDTFILAASRLNKANKNTPVIIIGHIKRQSLTTFETANTHCYQKAGRYTSPKLNQLLQGKRKS